MKNRTLAIFLFIFLFGSLSCSQGVEGKKPTLKSQIQELTLRVENLEKRLGELQVKADTFSSQRKPETHVVEKKIFSSK